MPSIALRAYTFQHQSAGEVVDLIYPLLSDHGTVELQPRGNTVIIRDAPPSLDRIVGLLRDLDRPARALRLRLQFVEAFAQAAAAPAESMLEEELERRLRRLLRYGGYQLLASTELDLREGVEAASGDNEGYWVTLRVGRLLGGKRVQLHGFRVFRQGGSEPAKPLINTDLNLWLDRPLILGLARDEASDRALMVVLSCSLLNATGEPELLAERD